MSAPRKPRREAWHAGQSVSALDGCAKLCEEHGYERAGPMIRDLLGLAKAPSVTALSNWYSTWPLRRAFLTAGQVAETVREVLQHESGADLDPDRVERIGQNVFMAAALKSMDLGGFVSLRRLSQKDAELALDRARFQRETCELFLRWQADARAREIAGSAASNADKIERLGQLVFGEDWQPPPAPAP